MSQPQAALRGVYLSTTAQLTLIPDCSHRHTENLLMLLPSVFSSSLNLQRSSWAVTQTHCWCSEPGMHHLCCNVQHQSKMTFFNVRRKNGEVLAVEIVRKVLRFQIKERKKHARFKQSVHTIQKESEVDDTQVIGFAIGFSVLNQNVKNTSYVCRYTAVTAITIPLWTRYLEQSLAKWGHVSTRPSIQVWSSELSVPKNTRIQRFSAVCFFFFN